MLLYLLYLKWLLQLLSKSSTIAGGLAVAIFRFRTLVAQCFSVLLEQFWVVARDSLQLIVLPSFEGGLTRVLEAGVASYMRPQLWLLSTVLSDLKRDGAVFLTGDFL